MWRDPRDMRPGNDPERVEEAEMTKHLYYSALEGMRCECDKDLINVRVAFISYKLGAGYSSASVARLPPGQQPVVLSGRARS